MRRILIFLPFISIVLTVSALASKSASEPERFWQNPTIKALQEIHDQLEENHPGAAIGEDVKFTSWLEEGLSLGIRQASKVSNYQDLKQIVSKYVNGFQDPHLMNEFIVDDRYTYWAGIILVPVGADLKVQFIDENFRYPDVKVGSILKSCDGMIPHVIFDKYVLPYHGRYGVEADYFKSTPYLFVNDGAYGQLTLHKCAFSTANGLKIVELKYLRDDRDWAMQNISRIAKPRNTNFEAKIVGGIPWFRIPSFQPGDKEIFDLRALVGEFRSWRNSPNIVIDLRGNAGGNSQWSEEILSSLYSGEYYQRSLSGDRKISKISYRVSKENLEYIQDLLGPLKEQFGADSFIFRHFDSVHLTMRDAVGTATSLISAQESNVQIPAGETKVEPAFKGQLWIVTDYHCFSTCLIFLDEIRALASNTVLLGMSTDADTSYMEIRRVRIGEGLSDLVFPIKVRRGRIRKDNQPYIPQHIFQDDINDEDKLYKWTLCSAFLLAGLLTRSFSL